MLNKWNKTLICKEIGNKIDTGNAGQTMPITFLIISRNFYQPSFGGREL